MNTTIAVFDKPDISDPLNQFCKVEAKRCILGETFFHSVIIENPPTFESLKEAEQTVLSVTFDLAAKRFPVALREQAQKEFRISQSAGALAETEGATSNK